MFRALILQFEPGDPPEHLGDRLATYGIPFDVVRMDQPHHALSLEAYGMLIPLGGSMSATQMARFPFLQEATTLLHQAVERRTPSLGICLGAQLLATTLGAAVTRAQRPEIGLVEVKLRSGVEDPLLEGLPESVDTLQFHQDTFGLPEGGLVLASSGDCATQIVRCAPHAYALQFHPEVSSHTFARWLEEDYAAVTRDDDPQSRQRLTEAVLAREASIRAHADHLLHNFIAFAVSAATSRP